jgi:hypothetical protein
MPKKRRAYQPRIVGGKVMMPADLYQTAETLTHPRHHPRLNMAPTSHWTTVHFCNRCPGGAARSMSQGLRVLVLHRFTNTRWSSGIDLSDEMRAVIEELWPELTQKLPPKAQQG